MPEEKPTAGGLPPFSLNQKVVYPLQGVGEITKITERLFKGKPTQYYEISIKVTDMTVMIPIDKATELGIRAIVSAEKANAAFDIIGSDFEPVTADWKMRYQMNLDHLKSGGIEDIALVVRNLYHRSKVKELPILERKLYDSAMKSLIDEIAESLTISVGEVEKRVHEKLEPLGKSLALMDPDADDEFPEVEVEEEEEEEE